MEKLPDSLLLQILSQLDDSADVARCRVASKSFNTVFPDLRSIDLQCSSKCYKSASSRFSFSPRVKPYKTVFLDLISKLRIVESVSIVSENTSLGKSRGVDYCNFNFTDGDFAKEWLPRVSESLKSLSLSRLCRRSRRQTDILPLISKYCHNLVSLKLKHVYLYVDNLNPMPMLTTLTLAFTRLEDEHINGFNKGFPNLQVLNLIRVQGLRDPKIHLLNLKTCHWTLFSALPSLTLITPNLITLTLTFDRMMTTGIHVEAPMLSHLNLGLRSACPFTARFENLKTVLLDSFCIGSILSEFPTTTTVESLTLDSGNKAQRVLELTLRRVFTVFPNVTSLCIKSGAWSELEACLNPQGWEILNGRKALKTISAFLMLVDPSLTFSSVARVLDQCDGLLEVSLNIHVNVAGTESFKSKCMARWPELKWRWGSWCEVFSVSWLNDFISNQTPQFF